MTFITSLRDVALVFPPKLALGNRLTSALIFFLNFDSFGKYLNKVEEKIYQNEISQANIFPRHDLGVYAHSASRKCVDLFNIFLRKVVVDHDDLLSSAWYLSLILT